jgi:hypothetical protein
MAKRAKPPPILPCAVAELWSKFFEKYCVKEFYKDGGYYSIHFYPKVYPDEGIMIKHGSDRCLQKLLTHLVTKNFNWNKVEIV